MIGVTSIDCRDVLKKYTITVKAKHATEMVCRLKLTKWLIILAAKVSGMGIHLEIEDTERRA